MRNAMVVLWPSFVAAGAGVVLLFMLLDPVDFRGVGPVGLSRTAGYTVGFFFLWGVAAASSALTVFLGRSAHEVNRASG